MSVETAARGRAEPLTVIGAPSSAGAYAPGQERAPFALRGAGLLESLRARGVAVRDAGDTPPFRWRIDEGNRRAMNAAAVAQTARASAPLVADALARGGPVLILGGDCTVELGTVSGALRATENIGLVYIDLDTDLNTPQSTTDGALDWMGVAHMLALPDTVPDLTSIGPRLPLLYPDQILYFAIDNVEPFERQMIQQLGIGHVPLQEVAAEPARAAKAVCETWARTFERLLIHLDVDVLDFARMPLAENTRRNVGLDFYQLMEALAVFVSAPNWATLTLCELNPDHGNSDGSTLRAFCDALADAIARAPRWPSP
jgi:arginase